MLVAGALVGLVAVSTAVFVEAIGTHYWIDEALSVGLARHDLVEIPSLLLRDGSPPLWYLLLHGWMLLFGTSAVATHALSLVFAVLTVPVAWYVARRLFGDRAAWLTASVAAVNPFVTHFASETRMYSLVVLLGLVVAGTFVAAFVDDEPGAARWFGVSLVALLYTHNWGIYTAIACVVALAPVVVAARHRRSLLRRAALTFALVAVAYLPWVPALLSQVQNTGAPWSFTPSLRDVVRELAAIFRDERILGVIVLAAGAGLAPLVRSRQSRDTLAVAALGTIAAVPVGIGWVVAHVEPSWATRYLAVVVGPLLLVVGVGLARARIVGVAAIVLMALLVLQPVTRLNGRHLPVDAKSNARDVAERVAPRLRAGDLVVVAQPEAVPLFRAELGPGLAYANPMGEVADPTVMDWRDAEARLRTASAADLAPLLDALPEGGRVLVVVPARDRAETDTGWIDLFRTAGRRTTRSLQADERFTLVDRVRGGPDPDVSFDATMWERVTNRPH